MRAAVMKNVYFTDYRNFRSRANISVYVSNVNLVTFYTFRALRQCLVLTAYVSADTKTFDC